MRINSPSTSELVSQDQRDTDDLKSIGNSQRTLLNVSVKSDVKPIEQFERNMGMTIAINAKAVKRNVMTPDKETTRGI